MRIITLIFSIVHADELFDFSSYEQNDFIKAECFFEVPYVLIIMASIVQFFQW